MTGSFYHASGARNNHGTAMELNPDGLWDFTCLCPNSECVKILDGIKQKALAGA
jgi:hypothetical protein